MPTEPKPITLKRAREIAMQVHADTEAGILRDRVQYAECCRKLSVLEMVIADRNRLLAEGRKR